MTRSWLIHVGVLVLLLGLGPRFALPAEASGQRPTNSQIAQAITEDNVYISPDMFALPYVHSNDVDRINNVVLDAEKRGVPVKVGIISHYPSDVHSPAAASDRLRNFADFSGVLILVTPQGMGVSSDQLSSSDISAIQRQAGPQCRVEAGDCAIKAINLAVPRVLAVQSAANRNAAVFWVVAMGIFGVVVVVLVLMTRRKRVALLANRPDETATPSET